MKIGFLVFNLDGMGGTSRSAVTQANALAGEHEVRLVSVTRSADRPHYDIDPRVAVDHLADVREPDAAHERESVLVPKRWDGQFSALTDVALQDALPRLDLDVLVTVTPALLAVAAQLVPDRTVLVHQEHRSSSDRTSGLEPLLAFAPRADVVAMLTQSTADWLREQLGEVTPEIVVMPNPLPIGATPQSRLDNPVVMTAGRLVAEKQFGRLVNAFAEIADRIPDWRLRILGDGPQLKELRRLARKADLVDRIELPGSVSNMAEEWATASIAALTSRAEGFPLVVQEAMAAGVPVVSLDSPSGPRAIIEHGRNGLLVPPDSPAGVAPALLQLATDEQLRRRLGAGALESSQQYDAHALARRWAGIFAAAQARRGGQSRVAARATAPRTVPLPRPDVDAQLSPAEARRATLSMAVEIARATSDAWFVVPGATPSVVVPIAARDDFLARLAGAALPAYLSLRDPALGGWPERRGEVAALATELRRGRTGTVFLEPWPGGLLGQGCSIGVEFWETSVGGDLVAPQPNRYARRVPRGATFVDVEVEGVRVRTLPLMAEPTVDECRFPVDVVYTWVDGDDPEWNAACEQRLAAMTGTALTRESSGRARFLSRDELRYSLRSLHLFAPWVRRINLVTAGQAPAWLDPDHPRVRVIDHREILPADALPTFSSHAIETALHHVPELSEQWVYFNDDVFLGRPVRPEIFFSPGGLNAAFMSPVIVGPDDVPGAPPFLKAAYNNRRLIRETFGVTTTHTLAHTPHPHRRSVLDEIERRFPEAVAATARAPFRSDTDLALLSSLAQHYGLLSGSSYVGRAEHRFVNLSGPGLNRQLNLLLERDQDFFCLGDDHEYAMPAAKVAERLAWFLETYFPVAAPWERSA
ncbi:stealth conserved region 3 domain-containing protein [Nocardioides sp. SR21]|uniref:stealth conserved region 3 domain-containing protein n=1 Tax=Nocardioides sp. SR21 TaxID=2919501 RepID=UPI001FA9C03D|nr:stealth conserved region 3 domain-containing protein [Nocardioides sp. SR21]